MLPWLCSAFPSCSRSLGGGEVGILPRYCNRQVEKVEPQQAADLLTWPPPANSDLLGGGGEERAVSCPECWEGLGGGASKSHFSSLAGHPNLALFQGCLLGSPGQSKALWPPQAGILGVWMVEGGALWGPAPSASGAKWEAWKHLGLFLSSLGYVGEGGHLKRGGGAVPARGLFRARLAGQRERGLAETRWGGGASEELRPPPDNAWSAFVSKVGAWARGAAPPAQFQPNSPRRKGQERRTGA